MNINKAGLNLQKSRSVSGDCDAQQLVLILPCKSASLWLRANQFHKALKTFKDQLATNSRVLEIIFNQTLHHQKCIRNFFNAVSISGQHL